MTGLESDDLFFHMNRPRLLGKEMLELLQPIEWGAIDTPIVLSSDAAPQAKLDELPTVARLLIKESVTPDQVVTWVKKATEQ